MTEKIVILNVLHEIHVIKKVFRIELARNKAFVDMHGQSHSVQQQFEFTHFGKLNFIRFSFKVISLSDEWM